VVIFIFLQGGQRVFSPGWCFFFHGINAALPPGSPRLTGMSGVCVLNTMFSDSKRQVIREQLLSWYSQHQRALPWRETDDPYKVAVSEFMLQQTQVSTVLPYYHRFLFRFPDMATLARAGVEDVLICWEGLGYYRRARLLKKMAECVHDDMHGQFPGTRMDLMKLPGIGHYTASAIASIVFQERVGVVDGNVYRVYSRLFDLDWDISASRSVSCYRELADRLVPESRPGDYNQAVMELGATVCSPRRPACGDCPLHFVCELVIRGIHPETRPVKTRRVRVRKEVMDCVWFVQRGKIALRQRPPRGLLAGMWELPQINRPVGECCLRVEYLYSHIQATYRVFSMNRPEPDPSISWFTQEQLKDIPLTGAFKKIMARMEPF
jgi:A/G-specific adenine glycosylase